MPLNDSQTAQVARAELETKIKRQIEKNFTKDMNRVFRKIGSDLGKTIAESGGTVSANVYANDVKVVLNKNYKRAQRKFSNEILRFLNENKNNLDEQIIRELRQIATARGSTINKMLAQMKKSVGIDLDASRAFNVLDSTDAITHTTQREIDRAVTKAEAALTKSLNRKPTNRELSRATTKIFKKRQKSRAQMISETETQVASEGAKQIERNNFSSTRNNQTSAELGLKDADAEGPWVTRGDSLVRDGDSSVFNHLAADGQLKKSGMYTVSGEKLRFPGDRSLGASIGNIARCRCSSVTNIH